MRRELVGLLAAGALSVPAHAAPELAPIETQTLLAGSPLHVVLDGSDPAGGGLSFEVATSDPELLAARVLEGNRSLRVRVTDYGDMVFELFEGRAPRVTERIVELAESGFYDGVAFHRIVSGFVIQGGDPTGTGAGGSELGPFDDQFHIELQHNRIGVLSMAKAGDDTNDSQFFVTAVPTRYLDYNHSVFGQLVAGEGVRAAIDAVATDSADRPVEPVVMESVGVFSDGENGVLVLAAPEGSTGTAVVTVTATDADGASVERSFQVEIAPDPENSPPFLADVAPIATRVDTPVTVQLQAIDVEGDAAFYLDEQTLANNGLGVPVVSSSNLEYSVDFQTGLLTITPLNGVTGVERITVATAVQAVAVDYQVLAVTIEP